VRPNRRHITDQESAITNESKINNQESTLDLLTPSARVIVAALAMMHYTVVHDQN
jgi:hypothetical protein